MDDVRAVMDAAGSKSAMLWSGGTSTGLSVLFAATYPDRCAGLVLFDQTGGGCCGGESGPDIQGPSR